MSIQAAFYHHLSNDTTVAGLVSARIYVDVAPSSVAGLNHITFQLISGTHEHHMTAAAGLTRKRVQVDVWATNSVSRDGISEAVREALDGYRGDMGATGSTVDVRMCHLVNETDGYESPVMGTEFGLFRRTMDWEIWHSESVPTFA